MKNKNEEKFTLEIGMVLFDSPPEEFDRTTYLIGGNEEELVKKVTRNLLALIAKHRQSESGLDMNEELDRLIKKYKV